jgi:hypothetical protein
MGANKITQATLVFLFFCDYFLGIFLEYSWNIFEKVFEKKFYFKIFYSHYFIEVYV